MRDKLTIIFFTLTFLSFGQTHSDTLFIANKKHPLIRINTFFNAYSRPVNLPSEYIPIKSEITFQYNSDSDSAFHIGYDDSGNQYTVIVAGKDPCSSIRTDKIIYTLSSLVDTLKINAKEFGLLRPYIKTKSKKIFFCSSRVDVIRNDTIQSIHHHPILGGKVFSYWDDNYGDKRINYENRKSAKYILRDLYYRKGEATYYFDRTFVILLN